jgi:hypothetical protein
MIIIYEILFIYIAIFHHSGRPFIIILAKNLICQPINKSNHILRMLQPAHDPLNHHVGQHAQTVLLLLTCSNAFQNHTPHEALVEHLARVVCEYQASVAEPVPLCALCLAGDCRCDGVEVLALFAGEVKVGVYHPVLKEGDTRHTKRNLQLAVQELARHVRYGVFRCGALGAHVREHFA